MKDLTLGELLRSCLAGAMFLCGAFVALVEPRTLLPNATTAAAFMASAAVVALTAGSLIYGLHRAVMYPILKLLAMRITGQGSRLIDQDLARWTRLNDPPSLLSHLSAWADQIHFLYCAAWSGFLTLGLGGFLWLTFTPHAGFIGLMSVVFFLAASLHLRNYQRYENRLLQEELHARVKARPSHARIKSRRRAAG